MGEVEAGPKIGGTERWVRMRRRFDAPPERVFRAWADPEELARWFPERVDGGLAVGARSSLVWSDHSVAWDVIEANPNHSFVVRWDGSPDDSVVSTLRITIDAAGYGSRLSLDDGPFPIEQPDALQAWASAIERWSEALAMLRAHLDFSVDLRGRG